ncbi:MAG TPA: M20/M25/M40 family metallo-hydrolase, partial [Candidatus Nitrosocosmicus sp.]|nr:M20/M25/M40 family metallo-hydrolase [Candidatus Nitrosocosmicus sp.]
MKSLSQLRQHITNYPTQKKIMLTQYKHLLTQFISTRSISTDTQFLFEINKTADWLKKTFEENQFKVQIIKGYDNPIVIAKHTVDTNLDTCLIYGHYDVQPADFSEGWKSDPFTATERNNKLFGRGVVDNKGQVLIHMTAAFQLIKEKKLGYNLIFMIEGNEETGSPLLEKFIHENNEILKSDF